MENINCKLCGAIFEPTNSLQRYCPECRNKYGANLARVSAKQDDIEAANRAKYSAIVPRTDLLTVNCEQCGEEFKITPEKLEGYKRLGKPVLCSTKCKNQYHVEHAVCAHCGENLFTKGIVVKSNVFVNFCSDSCKKTFFKEKQEKLFEQAKKAGHTRICAQCGKEYIVKTGDKSSRCCSSACFSKWNGDIIPPQRTPKKCLLCGNPFLGEAEDLFCSVDCQRKNGKIEREKREAKQKEVALQREKNKQQAYIESHGLCSLCKTPYIDCVRMTSNFTKHPLGAIFKDDKIVQCPIFSDKSSPRKKPRKSVKKLCEENS